MHIEARDAEGRSEAEENSGKNGKRKREKKGLAVDADVAQARNAFRAEHVNPVDTENREDNSQRAAAKREQDTFREQLANDAASTGAQGCAHGDFFAASDGAREQEICDVGACDQENERDGAEQNYQGAAGVADYLLLQRHDSEGETAIGRIFLRVILAEAGGERVHFGLGLRDGDAGLEFADDVVVFVVAILRGIGLHRKGQKNFGLIFSAVERGHHFSRQRE